MDDFDQRVASIGRDRARRFFIAKAVNLLVIVISLGVLFTVLSM